MVVEMVEEITILFLVRDTQAVAVELFVVEQVHLQMQVDQVEQELQHILQAHLSSMLAVVEAVLTLQVMIIHLLQMVEQVVEELADQEIIHQEAVEVVEYRIIF